MSLTPDSASGRGNAQRALPQHCLRVRAVASELARRNGCSAGEEQLLGDAALVHHYPPELLGPDTIASTLAIMQRHCRVEAVQLDASSRRRHLDNLLKLLRAFHSASLQNRGDALPGILTVANYHVERIEAPRRPGEEDPREAAIDALRRKAAEGLVTSAAFRTLQNFPRPHQSDLAQAVSRLPVYPAIALRALALAANEQISFAEISALVTKDQVLAGHLIGAANSCLYSPAGQITTIGHAIAYIGLEDTRRIVAAASMRPLFASAELAAIWKHSLEVATSAEELSSRVAGINKDEAFLCGLLHDVGRLLQMKHSGEASVSYRRLMEKGCDPVFAEACVFGCDHAELGAQVLEVWNFPEPLVEAVRCHHRPAESQGRMASLLYLVEPDGAGENGETMESSRERALAITGLTSDQLLVAAPDLGVLGSISAA